MEATKRKSPGTAKRPGSLAGTTEAMEVLGVPRSTISRWLDRDEMPQPEDVIAAGPVWKRAALEAFAEKRAAAE